MASFLHCLQKCLLSSQTLLTCHSLRSMVIDFLSVLTLTENFPSFRKKGKNTSKIVTLQKPIEDTISKWKSRSLLSSGRFLLLLITPNAMANNAKLAFSFSCCATFTYRKEMEFVTLLKYRFYKKPLHKRVPVVPFCDEKSVQLVRVVSFRSDFLQNPYFSAPSNGCTVVLLLCL